MPITPQKLVATLASLGLLLSGTAEADNFVVSHRETVHLQPPCVSFATKASDGSPATQVECASGAYVFNSDTSEVYMCKAGLTMITRSSDLRIMDEYKNAECAKQPKMFAGPSKYTFYGEYVRTDPVRPAGSAGGDALWVSDNTAFHVKACFHTVSPMIHLSCADATVK